MLAKRVDPVSLSPSVMENPPTPPSEAVRPAPSADRPDEATIHLRLRAQQNYPIAALAGSAAAVLGGIVWAAVTVATNYQIGWMAIGVGFAVGFAVRLGKGIDKAFGVLGAVLALVGCVLGNFFVIVGLASKQAEIGLLQTLGALDYSKVPDLMASTFSPMDLLFYAIAAYEGYKFSFRRVTHEEVLALQSS